MNESSRSRGAQAARRKRIQPKIVDGLGTIGIGLLTALDNFLARGLDGLGTGVIASKSRVWLLRLRLRVASMLRSRSLIGEILALQLGFALFVGSLAIGGLWWTSTWVIEDNLNQWGTQWISELDDLGMPLYASEDEDKFLRIESYINSFPEIAFVRYYSSAGDIVFETAPDLRNLDVPARDTDSLLALDGSGKMSEPTYLEIPERQTPLISISKAVLTESIASDGLLDMDFSDDAAVSSTLVGYVELGLDFSNYQSRLVRNIIIGSIFSICVLIILTSITGLFLRRALRPISQLQQPLRKLAQGDTEFSVEPTGHKEIVAITEALNSTVTALNERDKKLWQLANHDALTGLVGRHRFSELLLDEIEHVETHQETSALLFVDLDQFKYVNDTLGHAAGDRLLKQAAQRLKTGVRQDDIVSRFGGDEFTIIVKNVSPNEAASICDVLLQDMRDHLFVENGESFSITCSIGCTMIGVTRLTHTELMAQADMACHEAKSRGRNRCQAYEASGEEATQMAADAGWSQKIQEALREDKFSLHYQPIIDIASGQPTHYEVLLRLQHDDGQLIPPTAFLPAASRFGLMPEIDEWVIGRALRSLAEFRAEHGDIRFTLNISGNIFEDADLAGIIDRHLLENLLAPETLILEITEQVAVRNIVNASKQIESMSKLGCKFAIDDFGAGYSSYAYLKTLPVDYIKIDGAFIRNLARDQVDRTIVRSIVEIARATGKLTVAEHVMDRPTLQILADIGVDLAQGYYVGEPGDTPTRNKIKVVTPKSGRRLKRVS